MLRRYIAKIHKHTHTHMRLITFMKVLVGLRSPEVPGFCPSIGEVDTEVAARAPKPYSPPLMDAARLCTNPARVTSAVEEGRGEGDGLGLAQQRAPGWVVLRTVAAALLRGGSFFISHTAKKYMKKSGNQLGRMYWLRLCHSRCCPDVCCGCHASAIACHTFSLSRVRVGCGR